MVSGILVFILGFYEGRSGGISCPSAVQLRSVPVEEAVPCFEEEEKEGGEELASPLTSKTLAQCSTFPHYGDMRLHKHAVKKSSKKEGNLNLNGILPVAFHQLHHPDTPSKAEYLVASAGTITSSFDEEHPYSSCDSVYLTRSGSRESMPNKCVAVAMVPSKEHSQTHSSGTGDTEGGKDTNKDTAKGGAGEGPYHSPWFHSHRYGYVV